MDAIALVDDLRARVGGTVLAADDDGWDEARAPWARQVLQRPVAVVTAADAIDVATVLDVARAHGATVAVQPTGHGAHDALDGAIVLRMGAFDGVEVDVETRTARVGAGVLVGDLLAALDGTGLVAPSGSSRIVSVAGLVLGGGHGWLSRLGGLGGQWLRRAHVVLPDGAHRWIDDADPAMRLLRGAGGLVAIATELELDLLPVADLRGGALAFASEAARVVLLAASELATAAPGVALSIDLLAMPDVPALPEAIRGRSWTSVHAVLADVDDAVLDGIRTAAHPIADAIAPIAPGALHAIAGDPEEPGAAAGWSAFAPSLDDATIDAIVRARADPSLAAIVAIEVRLLGAMPAPLPTIVPAPSADWLVHCIAPIPPGGDGATQRSAVARLAALLAPVTVDATLPTFLGDAGLERALPEDALDAVRAWRAEHDGDVLHPSRLPR
ncbi:FAD-binding oxidoreductase [Agrococcus versicolor]|uniref:FAD-binding oxidoreductase n=1 Tax=Agrococcus versicolor TaxID=501482 RepID=A0ABP5MDE5_9MICO